MAMVVAGMSIVTHCHDMLVQGKLVTVPALPCGGCRLAAFGRKVNPMAIRCRANKTCEQTDRSMAGDLIDIW
jgi:hypothetical protein